MKIKSSLVNYNLRNPMYVKLAQQVQDASKEQADARLAHQQTVNAINNIANHNGINAAELEQIMRGLVQHPPVPKGFGQTIWTHLRKTAMTTLMVTAVALLEVLTIHTNHPHMT